MIDLSSLNPPQRDAVLHRGGPLLVLAGAGSGKTRVVTYRVASLVDEGVPPQAILAVTFTNKAAREMKERLAGLVGRSVAKGLTVSTFHAFGVRFLQGRIQRLGYRKKFSIMDQGDQVAMVRDLLKEVKADPKRYRPDDVLTQISLARNAGVQPGALLNSGNPWKMLAGRIMLRYQEAKLAVSAVDFDDLLILPIRLLREHRDVLDGARERYRHVIVDEYQDTNRVQLELLELLVGPGGNICAVGDDDQSIYGWRGARAANILEFERHFTGARIVALERNYRSTKEILDVANRLISHNQARHAKRLWSDVSFGVSPRLWVCKDEQDEAERVARAIKRAVSSGQRRPGSFGVLYRTNAQAKHFEFALTRERLPYRVVGGTRFFDRKEVRDALAYLRLMADPRDELALLRVINTPPRGIGRSTLLALGEHAKEAGLWETLRQVERVPGVGARERTAVQAFVDLVERHRRAFNGRADPGALRALFKEIRFFDELTRGITSHQARRRMDNVDRLMEQLARYEEADQGLHSFLVETTLDTARPEEDKAGGDEVTLMTLHAAKGLEFPVVFLVGLEEGLLPFSRQGEAPDLAEERRLCYVGVTRAREELYLTRAAYRTSGKTRERLSRKPSRFIREMALVEAGAPTVAEDPKAEAARRFADFIERLGTL